MPITQNLVHSARFRLVVTLLALVPDPVERQWT